MNTTHMNGLELIEQVCAAVNFHTGYHHGLSASSVQLSSCRRRLTTLKPYSTRFKRAKYHLFETTRSLSSPSHSRLVYSGQIALTRASKKCPLKNLPDRMCKRSVQTQREQNRDTTIIAWTTCLTVCAEPSMPLGCSCGHNSTGDPGLGCTVILCANVPASALWQHQLQ